jgi:hypothetical protein
MTSHVPGFWPPHALAPVALAVSLALVGCAARSSGDPEATGYFPHYGRGIDQDVATGHNSGVPHFGNLGLHDTQP